MAITQNQALHSAISQAIADVINEFFIRQHVPFGVLITRPHSENFSRVVDGTLSKLRDLYPINVSIFNAIDYEQRISGSAVIFREEAASLIKVNSISDFTRVRYLVYGHGCQRTVVSNTLTNVSVLATHTVKMLGFVVCQLNSTTLTLAHYDWFHPGRCHRSTWVTLNTFDIETRRWAKKLTNVKKFRNLNRCLVRVKHIFYDLKDKFGKVMSPFLHFSRILANYANFKLDFSTNANYKSPNLTLRMCDVTETRFGTLITSLFSSYSVGMMVSKGEPYTDYEKLLLPFDSVTWALFLMTFGAAFAVAFVANRTHKSVRYLLFGAGVTMPGFNILGTFFGIGQLRLPEKFFARFVLMMFIIYCLIFRTAYQGVLFEFMTSDMRKPHARTVDEVYERNFTVIGQNRSSYYRYIFRLVAGPGRNISFALPLKNVLDHARRLCPYVAENVTRTAIVNPVNLHRFIARYCRTEPIRIAEITMSQGICMENNHYLFGVVEEALARIIDSGIMRHFFEYYDWYHFERLHIAEEGGPTVLTMDSLSYGFNIWLATLAAAVAVFFGELIFSRVQKRKKAREENAEVPQGGEESNGTPFVVDLGEVFVDDLYDEAREDGSMQETVRDFSDEADRDLENDSLETLEMTMSSQNTIKKETFDDIDSELYIAWDSPEMNELEEELASRIEVFEEKV